MKIKSDGEKLIVKKKKKKRKAKIGDRIEVSVEDASSPGGVAYYAGNIDEISHNYLFLSHVSDQLRMENVGEVSIYIDDILKIKVHKKDD